MASIGVAGRLPNAAVTGFMLRLCLVAIAASCATHVIAQSPSADAGQELFEKKIRPALIRYCYECHAEDSDDVGGNLLLDTRAGMLAGGETGPAITPGKPAESLLIAAIEYRDLEMPPDEKMPDEVIVAFRRWIALGAPDPRQRKSDADAKVEVPSPNSDDASELWSLKPIAHPTPPEIAKKLAVERTEENDE